MMISGEKVIIFMDCQMPILNGYETASIIRKCEDKVNALKLESKEESDKFIFSTNNAL